MDSSVKGLALPPPVSPQSVQAFKDVVYELEMDGRIEFYWLKSTYICFCTTGLIRCAAVNITEKLLCELEIVLRCDLSIERIVFFNDITDGNSTKTLLGDYRKRMLEPWEIKTVLILLWENRV